MFNVRKAYLPDISQLQKLHSKWLSQNLCIGEQNDGFLTCEEYSYNDFVK